MRIPNVSDKRVRRTRRLLRDALLALVAERGWDAVSVLDVCERADIGRSTFYTHFAHKEALLLSGFDELREFLRADAKTVRGRSSSLPFLRGLIEHVHENRRMFRSLMGKHAGQLAQKNFRLFVFTMVREALGARNEAAARYVAGGIAELLIWSVDLRPAPETAQLEKLCLQFSEPLLARVR